MTFLLTYGGGCTAHAGHTHNIANKGFSGMRRFVARFNFLCTLIVNRSQSLTGHTATVRHKRKKTNDSGILLQKDKNKKNDIMNSPRTKLHICKPRHTSRCFSLQKSSFLADAPQNNDKFAHMKFE